MQNENIIANIILEAPSDPEMSMPKNIKVVDKHVEAECTLQEAEETNRNKRYYAAKYLFPAVLPEYNPRTKELLTTGNLRAESGHPDSKDLTRQQKIEKKNCSAIFLKMWREGNFLCARYRNTNNPLGMELMQDLLDGMLQSWSMRSIGSVVQGEHGAEVRNIGYITHDEVIYPSHPRAYTRGIVSSVTESASIEEVREADKAYIRNESGVIVPIVNDDVIRYIKAQSKNLDMIKESFDVFYDDIALQENGRSVQLTTKDGSILIVNLETYIHDSIMDYANTLI